MVKVWKIEEIPTTKMVNNDVVNLTDDERQAVLKDWNEYEQEKTDNNNLLCGWKVSASYRYLKKGRFP